MGTRVWMALALFLAGVLGAKIGVAADWSLVPSINAKTEFNSNINYDFINRKSDYIFTLSPAMEFNRTTETSQLQGRLGLTGQHFLSHGHIDHIDQNYQIYGQYRVTPRWNLSLKSAYSVDTSLQEEFLASGLIMSRTPRESIQVGPGVTYNVTERLAATVNYNINKVNYQAPQAQNYTSQQAGLMLNYPLKNQKTLLIGNVWGRETSYSASNRYRSLGINAGANHKFSENWEVNLLAGANISFFDFNTQVQDLSQFPFFVTVRQARFQKTGVSPLVNLSTTRRWTNLSVTAGYSRDESPSAFGSVSDLNRVFASLNYNFSEKLSGVVTGDYSLSNQVSQQSTFESDLFNISPQLNYRVTEKLTLSPGYRFSLRDDITNSRSATVQAVWLMMTYSYPIHYQR